MPVLNSSDFSRPSLSAIGKFSDIKTVNNNAKAAAERFALITETAPALTGTRKEKSLFTAYNPNGLVAKLFAALNGETPSEKEAAALSGLKAILAKKAYPSKAALENSIKALESAVKSRETAAAKPAAAKPAAAKPAAAKPAAALKKSA